MHHHAGIRKRDLVHAPLDRGVAVRVDDPRHHELARRIDDPRRQARHLRVRSHRGDLPAVDEDRSMLDLSVRDGEDGGVADDDVLRTGDGCDE
jgi:hypothetical protein